MRTVFIIKLFPLVVAALTACTFVLPSRMRIRAKALWMMVLLACASRGIVSDALGGPAQAPDFPEWLLWVWDWACSGLYLLFLLSLVWWVRRGRAIVLPVAAWGIAAYGFACGIMLPGVREVELAYPDLPQELDGYRIVQLSDLHCCASMRGWRTRGIVERVNACRPDLICLTGDYVDGYVDQLAGDLEPLRGLKAKDGVYAVRGNHEYFLDYMAWRKWFVANGFRFLVNECVFPRKSLALGGVNDDAAARRRRDVPADVRLAFAAATNGEFRVLLEHKPRDAEENFERHGVRLQLSGHTHGGISPGLDRIIARFNSGFVRGVYEMPGGYLNVSSGVGQWAGFPLRFFNPPEIVVIVLRSAEEGKEQQG